jgi:hypothetical protein
MIAWSRGSSSFLLGAVKRHPAVVEATQAVFETTAISEWLHILRDTP